MALIQKRAADGKAVLSRQGRRLRNFIVVVVALIVLISITSSSHGGSSSATPAQKNAALKTLGSSIKSHLATCTASTQDALTAVGLVIQAGATGVSENDLVQLDSISQSAQTVCDSTKNDDILNLGSVSVPASISAIDDLGDAPISAETWASNDVAAVLHDIQNIAESTGSDVANAAKLQSDEGTADQDSSEISNSFNDAATTLGTASPTLGLVTFGN